VMEWDLEIGSKRFEVKTASEDSGGSFQFNHVRLDRNYDYLLCLGIRPAEIRFGAWRKGEVSEKSAGTLVPMAEGQSVTFKLTKQPASMKKLKTCRIGLGKRSLQPNPNNQHAGILNAVFACECGSLGTGWPEKYIEVWEGLSERLRSILRGRVPPLAGQHISLVECIGGNHVDLRL